MDLFCGECSSGESTAEFSSEEVESWPDDSIASCIEDERHFVPGLDYLSRFHSQSLDASAREESVTWILQARGLLFNIYKNQLSLFLVYMQRWWFQTVLFVWLQVQAYYSFQPLTAYLAVNYMDRFLCARRLPVKALKRQRSHRAGSTLLGP